MNFVFLVAFVLSHLAPKDQPEVIGKITADNEFCVAEFVTFTNDVMGCFIIGKGECLSFNDANNFAATFLDKLHKSIQIIVLDSNHGPKTLVDTYSENETGEVRRLMTTRCQIGKDIPRLQQPSVQGGIPAAGNRETASRNAMGDFYFRLVTLALFCLVISPPS